jgi:hypothetical protein
MQFGLATTIRHKKNERYVASVKKRVIDEIFECVIQDV